MEEMVQMAKLITLVQGHHAPMLFLDGTIAKAPMILGKFPDVHEDKIKYLFSAGKSFSMKHEIGMLNKVFFVSEAWMGTNMTIQPSKDPKRIEVLIITGLDVVTNEQTLEMLKFVRDTKENLVDLQPMPLPDNGSIQSPLLPAFVAGY